jgi:hypothetical protein
VVGAIHNRGGGTPGEAAAVDPHHHSSRLLGTPGQLSVIKLRVKNNYKKTFVIHLLISGVFEILIQVL